MNDSELKKLLLETCPLRPGQESRAWSTLRDQLYGSPAKPTGFLWRWLYYPTWHGLALVLFLVLAGGGIDFLAFQAKPRALATADSQSPGIYATAFYSDAAQAQVVWLNGMDPATNKPTYLDPTMVIAGSSENAQPTGDPNRL
jgi:hypothetical protein